MIASVLNKIVIKSKVSSDKLDNVLIVDTPGHNNTDILNDFNDKRDYDVAEEELKSADVLLYLIKSEDGTLKQTDLEFLNKFDKEKPFFLILNKSSKKSISEIDKIYEHVKNDLKKFNNCIDIIAYDSIDEVIYKSLPGTGVELKCIQDIFKNDFVKKSNIYDAKNRIVELFEGVRETIYSRIQEAKEFLLESKEDRDFSESLIHEINHFEAIDITFNNFSKEIINEFENAFKRIQSQLQKQITISDNIYSKSQKTIFKTIEENNLLEFYYCFLGDGIDINKCNSLKYNPMTYAAKIGNFEMVKFFIDKNVDPYLLDDRGYNVLLTAIQSNHREIVKFLVNLDKTLLNSKSRSNESVNEIINKNTFVSWFNNEYNNENK